MFQIFFGALLMVAAYTAMVVASVSGRYRLCGRCCQPLDEKGECKLRCAHPTANQEIVVVDA